MKKSISLILFVSFITAVFAVQGSAQTFQVSQYDYLLNLGFTEEFLSNLPSDRIDALYLELYDQNVIVKDTITQSCSFEGKQEEHSLFGVLQQDHFQCSITAAFVCNSAGRVQNVIVVSNWNWKSGRPAVAEQDAARINWDSNFTYMAGSFYSYDYNQYEQVVQHLSSPTSSRQGGLGWYVQARYQGSGMSYFKLLPKRPMYNGSNYNTTLNFQYVHTTAYFGTTLSFAPEGIGIYIDTSGWSDSISTSCNVSYNL